MPCPEWWLKAARAKLAERGMTKRELSKRLIADGDLITEIMVIRCLHDEESKRVTTLEAVEAISDFLVIPHPVVIARNQAEALALHGTVAMFQVDVDQVKIAAGVPEADLSDHTPTLNTAHANSDGDAGDDDEALDGSGQKPPRRRSAAIRKPARAR